MRRFRQIQSLALLCAIAQGAAGPSLALPRSEPIAAAGNAFVQLVARKGTRNYSPGDSLTPDETAATKKEKDAASEAKAMEDCIRTWDAGTHITQSHWKEICKRQVNERGAQLDR
jgi:hypothetical protein